MKNLNLDVRYDDNTPDDEELDPNIDPDTGLFLICVEGHYQSAQPTVTEILAAGGPEAMARADVANSLDHGEILDFFDTKKYLESIVAEAEAEAQD